MEDIELLGPRVRIRRARIGDSDASFRWFADARVTEYLPLAGERSLPIEDILEFLSQASRDDAPNLSVGIELLTGRLIGCGGLRSILHGDSAEVSVVIGERDVWGSGYGREAMQLLLQFGFERFCLQTMWLVVRAENARAMRLFAGLGFVVVETLEGTAIVAGLPRDKFRMLLTREAWRSTVLAETVLTAIERADVNERSFGLAELCDECPALAENLGTERLKTILVATGCQCAKELVATWICVCPDDEAPLVALEATRAWLEEPTLERAARSAELGRAALHSFARTKGTGRQPSWPPHAWFARTCAWLAHAPRYGWQAVPAVLGLSKAGMRASLVSELAALLREARDGNS